MQEAEVREATRERQARELTEQLGPLVSELAAAVALLSQPSALARMWAALLVILVSGGKVCLAASACAAPSAARPGMR